MDIHDAPLQALIHKFNGMYRMPGSPFPSLDGVGDAAKRLIQFTSIMRKELDEVQDILVLLNTGELTPEMVKLRELLPPDVTTEELVLVSLFDWFSDIAVYAFSEGQRFGMPIEGGFRCVMASNFSKMGADGQPIYDSEMKLQKGPNYKRPEPDLLAVIRALQAHARSEAISQQMVEDSNITDVEVKSPPLAEVPSLGGIAGGAPSDAPGTYDGADDESRKAALG